MSVHSYTLQFNGVPDSDPIFSKKRVADTLTYGYLEMLGTLSKYKEGIEWVIDRELMLAAIAEKIVMAGFWKSSRSSQHFTI